MTYHQSELFILLAAAVAMFMLQLIRYDLVSSILLLLAAFLGIVPFDKLFSGFSHTAFITVAAVFIISRAIENTGILDLVANQIRLKRKVIWRQLSVICLVEFVISAFINNVVAAALMIPVALKIARLKNISRKIILMPLAFSSLLGGLLTLIATPSNLIISDYRAHYTAIPFSFFAFTPVGLFTGLFGIAFMAFIGWRLVPLATNEKEIESTEKTLQERFTVELKVKEPSTLIDKKISHIREEFEGKFQLLALVRDDKIIHDNLNYYVIKNNDALILETDKWTLNELIVSYHLLLEPRTKKITVPDHFLAELALLPQSPLCGQTVAKLDTDETYGFEIVAISRRNVALTERLGTIVLQPGDVLLIKSDQPIVQDQLHSLNCILVEESRIRTFSLKTTIKVFSIFAIALFCVIFNLVPIDITFFTAAIVMILTKSLSINKAYQSLNLPILILIATMIPVGEAMETTGTASLIAQTIYTYGQALPLWMNLYILLWACMLFANVMNNTAVALVFAPIALQIAAHWHASADPFLMAVAVGSTCVFLTPIGAPSNTLIMSPGNYRFSDYWILGFPLSLIVSIVATGLILIVWPFFP